MKFPTVISSEISYIFIVKWCFIRNFLENFSWDFGWNHSLNVISKISWEISHKIFPSNFYMKMSYEISYEFFSWNVIKNVWNLMWNFVWISYKFHIKIIHNVKWIISCNISWEIPYEILCEISLHDEFLRNSLWNFIGNKHFKWMSIRLRHRSMLCYLHWLLMIQHEGIYKSLFNSLYDQKESEFIFLSLPMISSERNLLKIC